MIKEIKYKDTIINIDDIVLTYIDEFTNKECVGSIEDFGSNRYSEGYADGYAEGWGHNFTELIHMDGLDMILKKYGSIWYRGQNRL